ncbi:MAG: DUF1573 domain-containing protein [Bacteroidota bacterium]
MKKVILVLFINITFFFQYSCNNENSNNSNETSSVIIKFENTVYDFGTIEYNSDGRCYFEFTNDSHQDLIINVVRTTCGCTRPEWPDEPVMPGEKGRIGITYNTKLPGRFHKSISVYSNAENSPVKLFIKGIVKKDNV